MRYLTIVLLAICITAYPLFPIHGGVSAPHLLSEKAVPTPDHGKNGSTLTIIMVTANPSLGTPSTIEVGQSVTFTAQGKDQNGNTVPIPYPVWGSDGVHCTRVVDSNDPNKCTYTATAENELSQFFI